MKTLKLRYIVLCLPIPHSIVIWSTSHSFEALYPPAAAVAGAKHGLLLGAAPSALDRHQQRQIKRALAQSHQQATIATADRPAFALPAAPTIAITCRRHNERACWGAAAPCTFASEGGRRKKQLEAMRDLVCELKDENVRLRKKNELERAYFESCITRMAGIRARPMASPRRSQSGWTARKARRRALCARGRHGQRQAERRLAIVGSGSGSSSAAACRLGRLPIETSEAAHAGGAPRLQRR